MGAWSKYQKQRRKKIRPRQTTPVAFAGLIQTHRILGQSLAVEDQSADPIAEIVAAVVALARK